MFFYKLSGCGFESSCSHLNFRFRACFEWIHSETRTWHDKNIQSKSIQFSLNCKSQYRRLNSFCRVLRCDFLLLISVKLKLLLSETLSLFKSNKQPYHRKYSLNWQTAIISYEKINPKLSLFKLNPTTIYIWIQILHIGNGIFGLFKDRLARLKHVSAIFYQIFIYHQKIALQKIWKMFFISSKKLFSFSRY